MSLALAFLGLPCGYGLRDIYLLDTASRYIEGPAANFERRLEELLMIFVVVSLIVVGVWFYFVRQRGRQFLREVAHTTKLYLQADNEPERSIEAFVHSPEFKGAVSADIGTPIMTLRGADRDQQVYQAAIKAAKLYRLRADVWRGN